MRSPDDRGGLGSVASAALGLGLGIAILVAGIVVSQVALGGGTVAVTATEKPAPTPSPSPTPLPTLPPPTQPPTPVPTPTPSLAPLKVDAAQGQGLQLAVLTAPVGYTLSAPTTGTVRIEHYQYVDGIIRDGTDVAGQPVYPYVFITSADQEVKLRPGALDTDVQMLVQNGAIVAKGQALLKIVGSGPSSWHYFYDEAINGQIVVSARSLPSGDQIDPVALFPR